MEIQKGFIHYKGNSLFCIKAGKGAKLLIAIHGFGNDASMFLPMAELLQNEYTVIAIDLPYHGYTKWQDKRFDFSALMSIVQGFKNEFGVEKLSLMGYSLGGRICLSISQKQPNWIDDMYLLASDGLKKDIVFQFATSNFFGKRIFKYVSHHPKGILNLAHKLNKSNLLSDIKYKLVNNILSDDAKRIQGYKIWMATNRLLAFKPIIQYNLKKYPFNLHLIMGRHDKLFTPEMGERFIKGMRHCDLKVLDAGHNFTSPEVMKQVAQCVLDNN